jgi:hypothetical protein
MPDAEGVSLDYRGYDGEAVQTRFQFTADVKILHTACVMLESDDASPIGRRRAA